MRDFKTPTQSPCATYTSTMGHHHIRRFPCTLAPHPCTKKLSISPRVLDPTDWQVKDMGKPEGMMNCHLNLTILLLIQIIWMIKHKVEHVKIITHKLYASSYIMIITRQLYSSLYALLCWRYDNMTLEEILFVFIPSFLSFLPRSQDLLDSSC